MSEDPFETVKALREVIEQRDAQVSELKVEVDRLKDGIAAGERERKKFISALKRTQPYLELAAGECDDPEEAQELNEFFEEIANLLP